MDVSKMVLGAASIRRQLAVRFSVIVVALLTGAHLSAQERAIYSNPLANGAEVSVTKQVITEFRSRPASANPGLPPEELFTDQEWKHIKYSVNLRISGSEPEKYVWEEWVEYQVAPQSSSSNSELRIEDTLLRDNTFYLLYNDSAFFTVSGARKNDDGNWIRLPPLRLAAQSGGRPVVKAEFRDKKKPQIVLEYLDGPDSQHRTWIWTLESDKWKRK